MRGDRASDCSKAPEVEIGRSSLATCRTHFHYFLGRRRISKGSPFQVEGPTLEDALCCLVEVVVRGTNSWPITEEQSNACRPYRPDTGLQSSQGHYQEDTARPKQPTYKRCTEQLGANAARHAYNLKPKHISVCVQ